ncbi:MAG TPA: metal ABC transporter permease [Candidatus Limnocylindria bacterium]|nr:metal ABC transporter permease [Candidatus Limnocylindria bacterium]
MISLIGEMLSFAFMARALLVGLIVAVCAALLGVSLVLKRYSMIGDGLSHVSFGAVAIGTALGFAPLAFTIPVVIVAALMLLRLSENSRIKGDAAIGMISAAALALGVVVLSLARGINADVSSYLFGSVLVLTASDVTLSAALGVAVLVLYVMLYRRIFAVTFDETFARATGVRADLLNMLIAAMTAVTIVLGIRLMGAMLISSLIIFPALTAMRVCRSFRAVAVTAALVSAAGFLIGMTVSYVASTPAGASVVLADACIFLLFALIRQVRVSGRLRGAALD